MSTDGEGRYFEANQTILASAVMEGICNVLNNMDVVLTDREEENLRVAVCAALGIESEDPS